MTLRVHQIEYRSKSDFTMGMPENSKDLLPIAHTNHLVRELMLSAVREAMRQERFTTRPIVEGMLIATDRHGCLVEITYDRSGWRVLMGTTDFTMAGQGKVEWQVYAD